MHVSLTIDFISSLVAKFILQSFSLVLPTYVWLLSSFSLSYPLALKVPNTATGDQEHSWIFRLYLLLMQY